MNRQPAVLVLMTCLAGTLLTAPDVTAQDSWRPFDERYPPWGTRPQLERPQRERPWSPPPEPQGGQPTTPIPREPQPLPPLQRGHQQIAPLLAPVERSDLPPVIANDGSGLPFGVWNGLDLQTAERLMGRLELPPRSPALMGLWRRLMTAAGEPSGATSAQFTAVRAEALYKSGQLEALGELLAAGSPQSDPLLAALFARYEIAIDRRDSGCSAVRTSAGRKQDLPKRLRGEILVLAGYCAAAAGEASGASLAAELAREEGLDDAGLLNALEALAAGRPPRLPRSGRITPTHYRLLKLAKAVDPAVIVERANAALLAALVLDPATDERLRVAAAEAAAGLNVITPEALAEAYRVPRFAADQLGHPLSADTDPLFRRALLFQAAESEHHPVRRAQALRAFLDEARRAGFYAHALAAAAPLTDSVPKGPDFAWFGETAVEAAIAAGSHASVRSWSAPADSGTRGRSPLEHWLALADIANPELRSARGLHLPALEELALQGRFSAPVLHRLATVLDALDYQVPMGLWQAASSTPQPNDGYLPETGVLTQLQDASSRKEFARTVLLVMHALGPKGAEDAHIIALGDAIRALKRIGLEADARRIGLEALFGAWPRSASH